MYSQIYRLDDGSRQLRDLECRGNLCIDAKRECVYLGCQGALNPVVDDDSSSKVFILQLHGNNKTDADIFEKQWSMAVPKRQVLAARVLLLARNYRKHVL